MDLDEAGQRPRLKGEKTWNPEGLGCGFHKREGTLGGCSRIFPALDKF
jgi:hypothetical protein